MPDLEQLDRFLQWDLVTLNPWGTPIWAAVGARLIPSQGVLWTSTTSGFAAKVRNLRLHPRVALLRWAPPEPAVMIRGEATVEEADGTENLTRLFRLMGGAGAQREFFGVSAEHPLWRRLYAAYWRRILIRVRVVEVWQEGESGWARELTGSFQAPAESPVEAGPRRPRRRPSNGMLAMAGRQMLLDGLPAAIAVSDPTAGAPMALPVLARDSAGLELLVPDAISPERQRASSLVVRVVDDSYEMARMVGWIGALDEGQGWRQFHPRSVYGFVKPPGLVPDLAAGLAAALAAAREGSGVSRPEVKRSARQAGGSPAPALLLPEAAWRALREMFAAAAADAPVLAGTAALTLDPRDRARLSVLAQRAALDRDFAHGLLLRGGRRVDAPTIARAAVRGRPRGLDLLGDARRRDQRRRRLRAELRRLLPAEMSFGIGGTGGAGSGPPPGTRQLLGAALMSVAESTVAALDRALARPEDER